MRLSLVTRFCTASLASVAQTLLLATLWHGPTLADEPSVRAAESQRVAVIGKIRPTVVAIYARGGQGGGSGVVIDKDGFALTNFHVVQGSGPVMQCGLADGVLYDAVLVGLDKVGDVALIKLLPKKEGTPFPFAPLGDSDKVREGDWSIAMGNPFLLATDFTPTVTFGLISGVHRYQYPEGTLLEYTDCIQTDTSINPGNSGGPLFNLQGELIGINGRGSFDKRARINSGVGYAISINQIKNFLGHLHAGLDADHAAPGFIVQSPSDEIQKLEIKDIQDDSDAFRRGLKVGDELIAFAGRPMQTVNEFKNVLGVYPKEWRLPLQYRSENKRKEALVRLMSLQLKDAEDPTKPQPGPPGPPGRPAPPPPPIPDTPAKKLYVEKKGFANYYFNEQHQKRLMDAFRKHGDFADLKGEWAVEMDLELKQRKAACRVTIGEQKIDDKNIHPLIKFSADGGNEYSLDPLKGNQGRDDLAVPSGSGGMLMAFYHYKRLLTEGTKGFVERETFHAGQEPFYPYPTDGSTPKSLKELRIDAEVLKTEHAGVATKWFFSRNEQKLLGFEVWVESNADPCEVFLSDYRPVEGRQLPHRIEIRHGDERFAVLTVKSYKLAAK